MNFNDKTILITGSGSGIGRATAYAFAEKGGTIIVSDINVDGGNETVSSITQKGGKATFIPADVSKYSEVESLLGEIINKYGRLDIAVNNAGIGANNLTKTAEHTLDDWDRVIAVNQTGVFYCMKLELQQMMKQGSGCIVNIASMAGLRGLPNNLAYVASKHAVVGMTKTAALEYAKKNIRVNAVCPVFTHSPMLEQLFQAKQGMREKLVYTIPMNRYAEASEMAEAILWLSAPESGFITGQALPVDGGLSA